MIGRVLKIFPVHIFFLPAFFVLHAVNEYFSLIWVSVILKFLFFYLAGALLIFVFGKLFFKDKWKSGVMTAAILAIFFFWGATHDLLKSVLNGNFLSSYSFLLPLILVLLAILATILKRLQRSPVRSNVFLNILCGIFLLIECATFVFKHIDDYEHKNNLSYSNQPLNPSLRAPSNAEKPDIFFIVFDEYASSQSLRQNLSFDNSELDSVLSRNGFHSIVNSKSNYNSTPLSISSTLSMQYFNVPLEQVKEIPKTRLMTFKSLTTSEVPQILEKQGYTIMNFGIVDLLHHPVQTYRSFYEDQKKTVYLETLLGRIERDIWWNVIQWNLSQPKDEQIRRDHIERDSTNYAYFLRELVKEVRLPRFVIAHVMMPHSPFYFDRNGRERKIGLDDSFHSDSLYLDQVQFTNRLIRQLATEQPRNFARPRVVIIEGDHGYRDANFRNRDKQFMNLNAWYFSDGDYRLLYDSISPVNDFRIIFNKYFKASLPLLKDSTVLLY